MNRHQRAPAGAGAAPRARARPHAGDRNSDGRAARPDEHDAIRAQPVRDGSIDRGDDEANAREAPRPRVAAREATRDALCRELIELERKVINAQQHVARHRGVSRAATRVAVSDVAPPFHSGELCGALEEAREARTVRFARRQCVVSKQKNREQTKECEQTKE